MKKFLPQFCLLVVVAIFLTACPYASDVPITQPKEEVKKELFGKWYEEEEDSWGSDDEEEEDKPDYYEIKKHEDFTYEISKHEWNSYSKEYDVSDYIAHTSTIDGMMFLNMQEDGEGSYYLHRMDVEGDRFTLFEVTDNIDEQFESSKDLYNFVKSYKDLSFFYNQDEVTYIKGKGK